MTSAGPDSIPTPRVPAAYDVVCLERFGEQALAAVEGPGSWLVVSSLRPDGRSTGDQVVAPLAALVWQRREQLTRMTIYLAGAATGWTHLAYAVVEQHPEGTVALVEIALLFPHSST